MNEPQMTMPDEHLLTAADDFRELVKSTGWACFQALIDQHEQEAAYGGHFDETAMQLPGYWRGYLTALRNLRTTPRRLVDEADKIHREREQAAEISERLRLRQPIPAEMLEPMDDGARLLRPVFGGGEEDDL